VANNGNLKPFGPDNPPPPNRGRKKGSKNRSTLLKKWLDVKSTVKNPETREDAKGTVEDKIEIAIIAKALKGDVSAYREIKDTLYGPLAQKHEHGGPDGEPIQHAHRFDLTKLDGNQLRALESILSTATDAE
jgi:hypothetical protein